MITSLKAKNILVTGSSMGIGKALARNFARQGANLILVDQDCWKDKLETWAGELRNTYHIRVWTFYGDLTDPDGPERLYAEVTKTVGEMYVLVNNAGICWYGKFSEMPTERLNRMILLNCLAYAKLSRLFLPAMIERNAGGILNVSSISAFQSVPIMGLYAATKAYTQSLTEAMRAELPKGSAVVISTLNPPFTRTQLMDDSRVPLDYIPVLSSFKTSEEVASAGVKAFMQGKDRFVPGLHNRIFYTGLVKFMPHWFMIYLASKVSRRLSEVLPPALSFLSISRSHRGFA